MPRLAEINLAGCRADACEEARACASEESDRGTARRLADARAPPASAVGREMLKGAGGMEHNPRPKGPNAGAKRPHQSRSD
jgi:hypothetical protein